MSDSENNVFPRNITLDRRTVLLGAAGVAGVGAAALGISFFANRPETIVENIVRVNLPGLEISSQDMDAFVADFFEMDKDTSFTEMKAFRALAPFVNIPPFRWFMPGKATNGVENFSRRVMTEFMMGSDFFETYAVNRSKVTYTGLFDPYVTTCANTLPMLFSDT